MINQLFNLKGRTALVTGSSRGIGRAIAMLLGEAGAQVRFHASKPSARLDDTLMEAKDKGIDCESVAADLSTPEGIETIAQTVKETDILILNASVQAYRTLTEFDPEDTRTSLALETLGLEEGDAEAFGVSMSMMNTQAYAIAAVLPAQGREEAVEEALQGYVDRQRSSFEFYLPDQYQVAQDARLETLEGGTVLLVMCQDADQVLEAIRSDLESAG